MVVVGEQERWINKLWANATIYVHLFIYARDATRCVNYVISSKLHFDITIQIFPCPPFLDGRPKVYHVTNTTSYP